MLAAVREAAARARAVGGARLAGGRAARTARWANRSFADRRRAATIAARYDKIHMFDVDLASGESWRESNAYRAGRGGRDRRDARSAGSAWRCATTSAFPRCSRRLAGDAAT